MSAEKVVNEITEFKPFETNLTEFKSQYVDIVYDLFDVDQEKKAKSDKQTIGKVISALDKKHKELKAPLKAKTDLIDHERRRIKDELLEMQGGIKHQLEQHEFKKVEHDAMLHNMVLAIESLAEFSEFQELPDSNRFKELITEAEAIDVDDSYDHRKADATLAKVDVLKKLKILLEQTTEKETEQAELQRLRDEEAARQQKEREDAIRKEAAEKAKLEAEQKAENDRIEAERKAKAEIEAAEKAKQKAIDDANREKMEAENAKKQQEAETKRRETLAANQERERIEHEQQIEADKKAELQRMEDAKKSKQAHRAKIHKQAKADFMKNGFSDEQATDLVTFIKDGKIKNISINY